MRPAPVTVLLLVAALLVGEAAAPPRDDGQWTMPGKDFAATRYSGLAAMTSANAARLHAVWSFSTGVLGWVKAPDLATGRLAWTAYSEGHDADVLAHSGTFKPFSDHGTDLALTS